MAHKIIGTAGHIDHGKSSLVKVLTGTDPDRLSEEQERGMTIDLGFAFLNEEIAFIDVPGHEKFIKNMVAGVSTVDIAMLVIAADDGVMPQTREHLDILSLLQLKRGLIALTKIDMVEAEWLDIVEDDIRDVVKNTFLQDAPILRASSITGEGIPELREALVTLVDQSEARQDRGIFWMPVDRSFSIKGHGTVVTGSVLSGRATVGDSYELLPQKRAVKIRGIQTHGSSSQRAELGDRAALNLQNIAKDEIERGNVLATLDYFTPTKILDAKLSLLPSAPKALTNRARVRLHLGTREIMARIKVLGAEKIDPGGSGYVQMMLEEKAVAQKRDPFVIRQYSPQLTIGGGLLLDVNPKPHKRTDAVVLDQLKKLESFDPSEIVTSLLLQQSQPIKANDLEKLSGFEQDILDPILETMKSQKQLLTFGAKGLLLHKSVYEKIKNSIQHTVTTFHEKEPLRPGIKKANLLAQTAKSMPPVFEAAVEELQTENVLALSNDIIKLASHEIQLSDEDKKLTNNIFQILQDGRFNTPPPKVMAQMLSCPQDRIQFGLQALLGLDKIIRFEGDIYFSKDAIADAQKKLLAFDGEEITVGEFRELLDTSRKFAMPLLTYFDSIGVTERVGDARVISRD
jgi:selenocysteine-specific elongation factor